MSNQTTYIVSAIVLAAIVIAGAIMYSSSPSVANNGEVLDNPTGQVAAPDLADITITNKDHVRGNVNASITMVEYSDFECPFCARFHPTALKALNDYTDDVRWIYRHFPIRSIHSEAQGSAEASECVYEQKGDEGFWIFVDSMFANQNKLSSSYYREVASEIGVNIEQFDSCVSSNKYADKVESDYQSGIQLGITGTPGTFVNGTLVAGAVPYEQLKAIIDSKL